MSRTWNLLSAVLIMVAAGFAVALLADPTLELSVVIVGIALIALVVFAARRGWMPPGWPGGGEG